MPFFGGCFSRKKKKTRKLKISAPLHLLVKGDPSFQCHAFKSKLFRKKRTCSVCHQPIHSQGSSCRVCKYACHKACEPKASTHCAEAGVRERASAGRHSRDPTPERYQGNQAWQIYQANRQLQRNEAAPLQNDPLAKPRQPPTKPLPQGRLVAGRRCRERQGQTSMEMNFITQRVMALCFPPDIDAAIYRDNLREVAQMLQTKRGDNYMIFNLSETRAELSELHHQVVEYGWPETLAPPLDKLCSICKAMDAWTAAAANNVAVLHSRAGSSDRGGWDRIGVVVSAYIHYSNICGTPDQALDRLAMKKFFDDKIRRLDHPSQKRYVNYLAGLLSGLIEINSSPLGLHHLVLVGSPQLRAAGGCRVFVRVYQGMVPVWTSGIYTVHDRAKYTVISPEIALQLRGDILIKCYHCESSTVRHVVFRVQFHTCAVSDSVLSFPRQDLDDACDDMRFPLDGGVELHFSRSSLGADQMAAPVHVDHTPDPITRWNSFEEFGRTGVLQPDAAEPVAHTEGPLDGSLYATVIKKAAAAASARSPPPGAASDRHELHTVSMDSGISSSGRERLSGGSSHSPTAPNSSSSGRSVTCDSSPLAAADTSPRAPPARAALSVTVHSTSTLKKQSSVDASQLDELLSGLLETCSNIPDLRPCQTPAPDIDTIRAPTFEPVQSYGARPVARAPLAPGAPAHVDSSGYASTQSPPHAPHTPHTPHTPRPAMVHYNGYKSDSTFSESFSVKGESDEIPYHARADSKPFSYASFGTAGRRRGSSPTGARHRSPELESGRPIEPAEPQRHQQLESPRLVRKLLVGGSGGSGGQPAAASKPTPPSPSLPRKQYTNGSTGRSPVTETYGSATSRTPVTETYGSVTSRSPVTETYGSVTSRTPVTETYGSATSRTPVTETYGSATSRTPVTETYGSATSRTPVTETYGSVTGRTKVTETYGSRSPANDAYGKPYNGGTPTSAAADTLRSNKSYNTDTMKSQRPYNTDTIKSYNTDTLKSQRSYNTDTMKSYNTDTLKSHNTDTLKSHRSYNTDTMKSNRSYDWESTIRSTRAEPSEPDSRAVEPYRRGGPAAARQPHLQLDDSSAKTVTTYDQNTNSVTTVSTQSFDVPCSPNPTRKIVETTKRYVVDDVPGRPTGVTRLEETIREFVIEDLPDGAASATDITWLQKQQQKLRDRQQARIRSERAPQEARILRELRQRQGHEDGYTSDTTLWTDTSRETSPAQFAPLHVNTSGAKGGNSAPVSPQLPGRSSSRERSFRYNQYSSSQHRPVQRRHSESAYDRDRPHVQLQVPGQRKVSNSDLTPEDEIDALVSAVRPDSPWKYRGTGVWVRDPPEPRPETPAFPNPPRTPYQNQTLPPKSPTTQRKLLTVTQTTKTYTRSAGAGPADRERSPSPAGQQVHFETTTSLESSPSAYQGHSRHSSVSSDTEVISAHPLFVKDISKWWYKPAISREQAIAVLRDQPAGSFVIRDSNSFPGAFGLALKVETPPANVAARGGDASSELVRHFLIETTSKGVRLKGCPNEPTFGSLPALVYQHSVTPLALPGKLVLPEAELDALDQVDSASALPHKHSQLLDSGAACTVVFLYSADVEALTGPQAVRRATADLFRQRTPPPEGVLVHFKVSNQGITLTDRHRKQFFRRHYNTSQVSHCSMDPEERRWTLRGDDGEPMGSLRIFGFVAKKGVSSGNNQCHLFAEYDSDQPASAIVNFVTNIMMANYSCRNNML